MAYDLIVRGGTVANGSGADASGAAPRTAYIVLECRSMLIRHAKNCR